MRILVVDDNRETADALSAFLTMNGHETETVYDGTSACLRAGTFAPDCAVVDIRMPDIDGFHVARTLRGSPNTADLRMIALTGERAESLVEHARDDLFEHYFLKPASPLAILAHIDGVPSVYSAKASPFAPVALSGR
jgi:two-component system CheB/CheR fusion protein